MELSQAGLVGAMVGAVIGFIIYKVVFTWLASSMRKTDRSEAERQEIERALSRMRLILMVGETAVARTPLEPEGQVLVQGELWRAIAQNGPVAVGEKVEVVGVNGLTLTVVKAADRR